MSDKEVGWEVSTASLVVGGRVFPQVSNLSLEDLLRILKLKDPRYRKKPRSKIASIFKMLVEYFGGDLDNLLYLVEKSVEGKMVVKE